MIVELHKQYGAPPFTLLDARMGYWKQRKKYWRKQGASGGHIGQLNNSQPEIKAGAFEGNSAFDPVLAECVYKWFCPRRGRVLDPFAGESVKGIVAEKLGRSYVGIELKQEQVDENRVRAKKVGVAPTWIQGNSAELSVLVPAKQRFDLIFTSPPYYDLEIYSNHKNDVSAFPSYEEFMEWYRNIFRQAVDRLEQNRFLVVKVGPIRDEKGFLRNFVAENISCFLGMGLRFYNEAILATAFGSAPVRVGGQFPNYRKLVNTHQHLLCFFKGDDCRLIPEELGVVKT